MKKEKFFWPFIHPYPPASLLPPSSTLPPQTNYNRMGWTNKYLSKTNGLNLSGFLCDMSCVAYVLCCCREVCHS